MDKTPKISKTNTSDLKSADNSVLSCLFSLPPTQFTLLSTVIGFLFVDGLDLGQQNSLGNFIVGIGQTILIAAAQGQLLESNQASASQDDLQKQIQLLKKQVDSLEKRID